MGRQAWLKKTRNGKEMKKEKAELSKIRSEAKYQQELLMRNRRAAEYLPEEILILILKHLGSEDQIRFRAVCRSWHAVERVKPRPPIPWLFIQNKDLKIYFLFNPITSKSLCFGAPFKNTCSKHPLKKDNNIQILATSSGWLLLGFPCCKKATFLYNPFTCCTLKLPTQSTLPFWIERHYAFNYCPVEQRFTVYTLCHTRRSTVMVDMWCSGDQDWKTEMLTGTDINLDLFKCSFSLICGSGVLYCYFQCERMVVALRHTSHGFDSTEVNLAGAGLFDVSLGLLDGDLYIMSKDPYYLECDMIAARVDFNEKTWIFDNTKEKAYFHGDEKISAVVVSEPSKEFTGHVVVSKPSKKFTGHVVSRNGINSGILDSFVPWPRNVISYFRRTRLESLNTFWIEPPTQ